MLARSLPPGPPGRFLVGNLLEFRRDNLAFYTRCARQYGDIVSYRFGPKQIIQVNHPDLIEEVLVTRNRHFTRGFGHDLLRPVLGNGLLTSDGDFWLRQRRLAQPAFLRQRLAAYGDIMVRYAERMIATWQPGETRDLHQDMMHLTMEIAAKTLFDADIAGQDEDVGKAFEVIQGNFNSRFNSLLTLPSWLPSPRRFRLRRATRQLDRIIYRMIDQRRATGEDKGDLLSMLLQAQDEDGSQMTNRQLRDESMTLFLAGHETTALALAWTWYLLAQHPQVEAKLTAELRQVLNGRAPTAADIPKLPFAESVVMESMRLYPPAYGFGRTVQQDYELGGYLLPRGATVFLLQWVMHRDPRYFDDPEKFHPDRWADGLAKRLPKFAYFPFGGGPRVCIGNSFAMLEATLVLATIARRLRFELVPEHVVEPWASITLRTKNGIKAVVFRK